MGSGLQPLVATVSRRVLLFVEDGALLELLGDALGDAGHSSHAVSDFADLDGALSASFDAAIVDLDTRARTGEAAVARLRQSAPSVTVIALLPCGGLPRGREVACHLAIEKPARLEAVLRALEAAPVRARN